MTAYLSDVLVLLVLFTAHSNNYFYLYLKYYLYSAFAPFIIPSLSIAHSQFVVIDSRG